MPISKELPDFDLSDALCNSLRKRVRRQIGRQTDKVFGIFEEETQPGTRNITAWQGRVGPFIATTIEGLTREFPDGRAATAKIDMLQGDVKGDLVDNGVEFELHHQQEIDGPTSYVRVLLGGVWYDTRRARVQSLEPEFVIRGESPEFRALGERIVGRFQREIRVAEPRKV